MPSVKAIVVAAGSGSRFGSDIPKQFCLLDGKPVVVHAIERLRAANEMDVAVVISADYLSLWQEIAKKWGLDEIKTAIGGATRWESVKNGLKQLDIASHDVVLIHDGARPMVDRATVERVINATREHDGAIPTVAVTDSLREVDASGKSRNVDRTRFRAVQTPQGFIATKLLNAYELPFDPLFTDDASVMAAAGYHDMTLVEGNISNIKITHPLDIAIAELYLKDEGAR